MLVIGQILSHIQARIHNAIRRPLSIRVLSLTLQDLHYHLYLSLVDQRFACPSCTRCYTETSSDRFDANIVHITIIVRTGRMCGEVISCFLTIISSSCHFMGDRRRSFAVIRYLLNGVATIESTTPFITSPSLTDRSRRKSTTTSSEERTELSTLHTVVGLNRQPRYLLQVLE